MKEHYLIDGGCLYSGLESTGNPVITIDVEYPDHIQCSDSVKQQIACAFRHILSKCGMIVEAGIIDRTIHKSVTEMEAKQLRETIKRLENEREKLFKENQRLRLDRTATTIGFAVMCILYIAAVLICRFS